MRDNLREREECAVREIVKDADRQEAEAERSI